MKSMKKFLAALLVMSMVLALASTAFAYKDKKVEKFVLFKGSAYGYTKITNNIGHKKDFSNVVLRKGSIGKVIAEKGNWYKVEIPGKGGIYFNKDFTRKTAAEKEFLIYSTAGSRKGKGAEQDCSYVEAIEGIKIKTSGSTKLYKYGSLSSKVLKSLKKGKTVKLTGSIARDARLNTYFEVSYGKKVGFVPASRLDRTGVYKIMKKVKVVESGE